MTLMQERPRLQRLSWWGAAALLVAVTIAVWGLVVVMAL
jgi:hypothetical protein